MPVADAPFSPAPAAPALPSEFNRVEFQRNGFAMLHAWLGKSVNWICVCVVNWISESTELGLCSGSLAWRIRSRKLAEEWKELSAKQSSLEARRGCLNSFREKNENALNGGVDVSCQAFFKDADKYCKVVLGSLSRGRGHGCVKTVAFAIVLAVGAAVMSPSVKEWNWNKFSFMFNVQQMV